MRVLKKEVRAKIGIEVVDEKKKNSKQRSLKVSEKNETENQFSKFLI